MSICEEGVFFEKHSDMIEIHHMTNDDDEWIDAEEDHQSVTHLEEEKGMPDCSEKTLFDILDYLRSIEVKLEKKKKAASKDDEEDSEVEDEDGRVDGAEEEWHFSFHIIHHQLTRSISILEKQLKTEGSVINEKVESLLHGVREELRQNDTNIDNTIALSFIQRFVSAFTEILHTMCPIDMGKLLDLLHANKNAGAAIEDKDILLLIGSTGSGKTTTIHYLAGSSFEEKEVDGHFHLEPVNIRHPALSSFETSAQSRSVTRSVQAIEVTTGDGKSITICDSPGFEDTDGAEQDIANSWGVLQAIHRARRVKPIVVLSEKGMGDRFEGVSRVLSTLSGLFGNRSSSFSTSPLAYAFTKYEPRFKCLLYKQFRAKRNALTNDERANPHFEAIINDIVKKTKPTAQIISPLNEDERDATLDALAEGDWFEEPRDTFVSFVSKSSQDKLDLQLQITYQQFCKALGRNDAKYSFFKLKQLSSLADLLDLGNARSFAQQARKDASDFIMKKEKHFSSFLDNCLKFYDHQAAFHRELDQARKTFDALLPFQCICDELFPDSTVGTNNCVQKVISLLKDLGDRILSLGNKSEFIDVLQKQRNDITLTLECMKDVTHTFCDILCSELHGADMYEQCCSIIIGAVQNYLEEGLRWNYSSISTDTIQELDAHAEFSSFMINTLASHTIITDQLDNCGRMLRDLLNTVQSDIEKLRLNAKGFLEDTNDTELSEMVKIDCKSVANIGDILGYLSKHPGPLSNLSSAVDMSQNLEELEAAIMKYIDVLVNTAHAAFSSAKKGPNSNLESLACEMANVKKVCDFFRHYSHRISQDCDTQFNKVIVLCKCIDDHAKSLTDKQGAMIKDAESYLKAIESGNLSSVSLSNIASAWLDWEKAVVEKPKKKRGGIVTSIFSFVGITSGESNTESDFVYCMKKLQIKIGQGVRRGLKCVHSKLFMLDDKEYNTTYFFDILPEVLFFVEFLTLESRKMTLSTWVLSPQNHYEARDIRKRHSRSQELLSSVIASLSQPLSVVEKCNFNFLNKILFFLQDTTEFWVQLKKFARKLDTEIQCHHKLRKSILGAKDYFMLRQEVISLMNSFETELHNISFLDEKRVNSVNEHDRNTYYQEVAQKLLAVKHFLVVKDHLPLEKADIRRMWQKATEVIRDETEQIFKSVMIMMDSFPHVPTDYKKLYVLLGNLISIKDCFEEVEPKISGTASRLRYDADREMQKKLSAIVSETKTIKDNRKEFIAVLITLKKASVQVACWRVELNNSIDKVFISSSDGVDNAGRFILGIELELKKVEGNDMPIARQILSEHECFRGAMNAVFNSAVARQGIDYVINALDFSSEMQETLLSMYNTFKDKYESLVEDGLVACTESISETDYFNNLVSVCQDVAKDSSIDYRTQIVCLTAYIFAYWSMKSMNSFVSSAMSNDAGAGCSAAASEYLMKPHAAQVVAIWSLLNFQQKEYRILENHLVEILTGEGKSIALGVTAVVLAMMNCDVVCICYSEYLSNRDFSAFESMFKDFGVGSFIRYTTVIWACNDVQNQEGDTREMTDDVIWGRTRRMDQRKDESRMRILLIDEVDVFFTDDFYGQIFYTATIIRHKAISKLFWYVWKNRDSLTTESILLSVEAQVCADLFPRDTRPIVEQKIKDMLQDAKNIVTHQYFVSQERVCYKELDGLSFSSSYGHLTAFANMKEYEKGRVSQCALEDNLGLVIRCGQSSYAEMTNMFDHILGVTGTLKGLTEEESDILINQYHVSKMTYMPSVYGNNKLLFAGDNPRDTILCDDEANFFMELRNEIDTRRKPDNKGGETRAVMVFFENSEVLQRFYDSEHMHPLKLITRTITEEINPSDKEGAFLQATGAGAITLMIREYGRGTDFKCYDSRMIDSGGVHVIQAFFAMEVAEEIQIKGRAARQGAKGSYSMVLNVNDLKKKFKISTSDINEMRLQSKIYSLLYSKRANAYSKVCRRRSSSVSEAESCHYETMNYKDCIVNNEREEVISYLRKWNIDNNFSALPSSSVRNRESFLKEKAERIARFEAEEKLKRQQARIKSMTDSKSPSEETKEEKNFSEQNEHADVDSDPTAQAPMIEDETYYDMLGISRDAELRDIEKAFRKASLTCHPDICKNPNSKDRFEKLCKAKDILSNPQKRRVYDEGMGERHNTN